MDIKFFLGVITGFLGAIWVVSVFINKRWSSYRHVRSLYGRVCLTLDESRLVAKEDDRFKNHGHNIPSDAKFITAVDFMPSPSDVERHLLSDLEQLSPTLFYRGLWLIIPSVVTSLLLVGLFCVGFMAVPDAADWIVKAPHGAFIVSALVACLISYGVLVYYTQYKFERHVEQVKLAASNGIIWAMGKGHTTSNRPLVAAKDDPAYTALSK